MSFFTTNLKLNIRKFTKGSLLWVFVTTSWHIFLKNVRRSTEATYSSSDSSFWSLFTFNSLSMLSSGEVSSSDSKWNNHFYSIMNECDLVKSNIVWWIKHAAVEFNNILHNIINTVQNCIFKVFIVLNCGCVSNSTKQPESKEKISYLHGLNISLVFFFFQ